MTDVKDMHTFSLSSDEVEIICVALADLLVHHAIEGVILEPSKVRLAREVYRIFRDVLVHSGMLDRS